jgi:hypothetical protein
LVPDCEEKQNQKTPFQPGHYLQAESARDHANQQYTNNRIQPERPDPNSANGMADSNHEKNGNLRVVAQRCYEPRHGLLAKPRFES